MRIRCVYLRGHPLLGDVTVDMRDETGKAYGAVTLIGGCGVGKTLMSDIAGICWGSSVAGKDLPYSLQGCRGRVEFEVGSEIAIVELEGSRATGSPLLRSTSSIEGRRGVLLKYGLERLGSLGQGIGSSQPLGVRSVHSICSDISSGGFSDSVIWVDDLDLGLSVNDQKAFWSYLWKHHRSGGNQLIASLRQDIGLSGHKVLLSGGFNPVEQALKL